MCKVTFLNEAGERVVKSFDSPFLASKLVWKLMRSKKCELISYSGFVLGA